MQPKYINTDTINLSIHNNVSEFISLSENSYFYQLKATAEKIISEHKEKPLVLISGPSGSGKTTSSLRIVKLIEEMSNYKAISISMDNYFLPLSKEELESGSIDFESPSRIDIPLFSEHLLKLFRCEKIDMPVFDFSIQDRKETIPVVRDKNQIIIIEGIHALNPDVTGDTHSFTNCIYVSVRTRLKSKSGDVLHPSKIRLMRRLCRDSLFRGRKYEDVFSFFSSVSRGENLYIMPYKSRADLEIDTFIPYEANAYKKILYNNLMSIQDIMSNNNDYNQIIRFLEMLDEFDNSYIPEDSIVREFIGGSSLNY